MVFIIDSSLANQSSNYLRTGRKKKKISWISLRSVTSLPLSLSDHEPESYYCLLSVNKSFPRSQPFTLKWASHAPPRLTPDFDTFHPWHDLLTGKWCHRQCEAGFLEARSLLMKCNEGNPARARTRVVNKTWALFPRGAAVFLAAVSLGTRQRGRFMSVLWRDRDVICSPTWTISTLLTNRSSKMFSLHPTVLRPPW